MCDLSWQWVRAQWLHYTIFWGSGHCPLEIHKTVLEDSAWVEMHISGEEHRVFVPQIAQCCLNEGKVQTKVGPTHREETKRKYDSGCMVILSESRSDWHCMQTWIKDSINRSTCMWVKQVAELMTVREKQFLACHNSEMSTQTETILVQASIHVSDKKRSKKSRKH